MRASPAPPRKNAQGSSRAGTGLVLAAQQLPDRFGVQAALLRRHQGLLGECAGRDDDADRLDLADPVLVGVLGGLGLPAHSAGHRPEIDQAHRLKSVGRDLVALLHSQRLLLDLVGDLSQSLLPARPVQADLLAFVLGEQVQLLRRLRLPLLLQDAVRAGPSGGREATPPPPARDRPTCLPHRSAPPRHARASSGARSFGVLARTSARARAVACGGGRRGSAQRGVELGQGGLLPTVAEGAKGRAVASRLYPGRGDRDDLLVQPCVAFGP